MRLSGAKGARHVGVRTMHRRRETHRAGGPASAKSPRIPHWLPTEPVSVDAATGSMAGSLAWQGLLRIGVSQYVAPHSGNTNRPLTSQEKPNHKNTSATPISHHQ